MSSKPKPTEMEYLKWAESNIDSTYGGRFRGFYQSNIGPALLQVQDAKFIAELDAELDSWNREERASTSARLTMDGQSLALLSKSFESTVNKCFRQNVLWNKRFPAPPQDGWITPLQVFERLNDLVRGMLVCKYADGPEKLAKRLASRAKALSLPHRFYSQGREDGYYAYHFYVHIPVELFDFQQQPMNTAISVEIQITTQLQEVLRQFTHEIYEVNRVATMNDQGAWKWDLGSKRFRAGYLAHTLHLLEAIVVDLRDKNTGAGAAE